MMNIEEITIKLLETKISADQLFYMKLLSDNKQEIASPFIDYCYYGKDQIESLIIKGYLDDRGTLSNKGYELISDFVFDSLESSTDGVEGWIDEYRDKFKHISVRNRPLTGNKIDCLAKMKKFISKYKYDKDTILKATDKYIDRMSNDKTFMQSADYFILKHSTSNLASECESLDQNYKPYNKFEDTTEFIV